MIAPRSRSDPSSSAPASRAADRVPRWVEGWGLGVLLAGLAVYVLTTGIWLLAYAHQVDAMIYRFGGQAILHRTPLYDVGLSGKPEELLFNYPPFAAVAFTPLVLLPLTVLRILLPIVNIALFALVIRRCWRAMGVERGWELRSLTMMGVGALLWLAPVHTTIALGQIGLVLLAILVFDLLPLNGTHRWNGVGVGLAAGIKLTPLFFIPFLLVTGRARAAALATATFAATVGVGFLVTPSQAHEYWLGGTFHDLGRIVSTATSGNESLWGALSGVNRLGRSPFAVWVLVALIVSAVTLAIAAEAHRRGEELLAVALCGLGSAAVSPFSWGYQWVWFALLAVFLTYRAIVLRSRASWALLGVLWALTAAWVTSWRDPISGQTPPEGLTSLQSGGWVGEITRDGYLVVFSVALLLSVVLLRVPERLEGSGAAC